MANGYDELLGPPTESETMRAMADRLRRREAVGTLASFTGDPILSPWGQQQLRDVRGERERLSRATMEQERLRPSGNPNYFLKGNQLVPVPGMEERLAAQRAHELELARLRRQGGLGRWQAQQEVRRQYIPESTWAGKGGVAEGLTNIQALGSLVKPIAESEDIAQPVADVLQDILGNIGLGGVTRLTEPLYKDLNARQLRSSLEHAITGIRNSLFGAALTQYEANRFEQVSPLAPGLTKEAMVTRTKKMVDYLTNQARNKISGRMAPSGEPMPTFVEEGWAWEEPLVKPDDPGGPMASAGEAASGIVAAIPAAQAAPSAGPPVGEVVDGYRYKGGDPNNPDSWEPAQ